MSAWSDTPGRVAAEHRARASVDVYVRYFAAVFRQLPLLAGATDVKLPLGVVIGIVTG